MASLWVSVCSPRVMASTAVTDFSAITGPGSDPHHVLAGGEGVPPALPRAGSFKKVLNGTTAAWGATLLYPRGQPGVG